MGSKFAIFNYATKSLGGYIDIDYLNTINKKSHYENKKSLGTLLLFALCLDAGAIDNRGITFSQLASDRFTLVENGTPNAILIDEQEDTGVMIAAKNLQNDFERVTGKAADLLFEPGVKRVVIVGTLKSRYIKELVKAKKIDASLLNGKNENI